MEKQVYSIDDIRDLREKAKATNPACKLINLKDIELTENSIATNVIKFQGVDVRVADGFIRDLAKILNVNIKLQKNLQSDDEVGKEMLADLLNAMRLFNSRKKNSQVTLVGDVQNGIFTNVVSGAYARMSNEGLLDIAADLMKAHDGLQLIEANISDHQPDLMLKLLAPNEHKLVKCDDEVFNFGLTLSNNAINTFVGDFAYRLVCTNGMMGLKSENNFKLSDIGTQGLLDMQTHLADASRRNFMPADFEANIGTAKDVEASFKEVEEAFKYVKSQLNCLDDQRDRIEMAIAFRYFPGYFNTLDKLKKNNIDPASLSIDEKKFLPSGMTMWDLINNITDLGSNDRGYTFLQRDKLQVYGGKLMTKNADLKYVKYLKLK